MLDLSNSKDININTETFCRMTKLRLLRIYYKTYQHFTVCKQHMSGDFNFLSHECPLRSLPSNFNPKNLVHLEIPYGHLEQLWEGMEPLNKLKGINLCQSQNLKKTPDLTNVANLEELHLSDCGSLLEVHPSILAHKKLVCLSLNRCKELKSLGSGIKVKSLQTLVLSGCSKLENFPEIVDVMKELSEVYLDGTAIQELPSSINNLTGLTMLKLRSCKELKILPSFDQMESLKVFDLSGCSMLERFPEMSEVMKKLSVLFLDDIAIKELPASIGRLQELELLSMRNCRRLVSVSENICNLMRLQHLILAECPELHRLPENLRRSKYLSNLQINGSPARKIDVRCARRDVRGGKWYQ